MLTLSQGRGLDLTTHYLIWSALLWLQKALQDVAQVASDAISVRSGLWAMQLYSPSASRYPSEVVLMMGCHRQHHFQNVTYDKKIKERIALLKNQRSNCAWAQSELSFTGEAGGAPQRLVAWGWHFQSMNSVLYTLFQMCHSKAAWQGSLGLAKALSTQ